jgi:hypothetical protein
MATMATVRQNWGTKVRRLHWLGAVTLAVVAPGGPIGQPPAVARGVADHQTGL